MGKKGNGHRSSTTKPSRAKNKDNNLALKHKISRMKKYVKDHPTDLQAKNNLDKLLSKV